MLSGRGSSASEEEDGEREQRRTDQAETKRFLTSLRLPHHARLADVKKDFSSKLDFVRLSEKETVLRRKMGEPAERGKQVEQMNL